MAVVDRRNQTGFGLILVMTVVATSAGFHADGVRCARPRGVAVTGQLRMTLSRDVAVNWFSSVTSTAKRFHGQLPALVGYRPCLAGQPTSPSLPEHLPLDDVPSVEPVLGWHRLDLPPPGSKA